MNYKYLNMRTQTNKQIKIAIIHPTFGYNGGAENLILYTLRSWIKSGVDVTIYTKKIRIGVEDSIKQKYADISINPFTFAKTTKYLLSEIINFDFVLIHNFPATIFWGLIFKKAKKENIKLPKSFWYCHEPSVRLYGHDVASFEKSKKSLDIVAIITKIYDFNGVRNIDHIFANSKRTQNHIKTVYGRASKVIYPAIMHIEIEKSKPKHFFYVGRIEAPKNIENAILAFDKLIKNDKYKDIKFFIAGSGRNIDNIKKLINSLNINNNVILTGFITDEEKFNYLKESYCLLMPAIYEPFGLTVVEAWMSKTTAIISLNAGVSEVAKDGVIFADVLDYNSIYESMMTIIDDVTLREKLILEGERNILENSLYIDSHASKLLDNILTNKNEHFNS